MIIIKLVIALTGASGINYGVRLLEVLSELNEVNVHLILSDAALELIELESDYEVEEIRELSNRVYDEDDLEAPIASGSFLTDGMVIVPASQKTIGALASGYSNNLIIRAADVCLKENRKLVLVPRETPLNDIHLENMLALSRSGAQVLPASPGFYHDPDNLDDVFDFVVGKILDQFEIEHELFERWA